MNANDVIEAYVTDVAVRLPRGQRNDVAFELRALLDEELRAKAAAAGRAADAEMATELARAFGPPADVAARYRPALTIVDPADGPAFLRATVIGLAIIWGLGLVVHLRPPYASAGDFLLALGSWWTGAVIPSLWWPGVLVVNFAVAAWSRRRWPRTSDWKPRASDRIHGGPAALVMGIVGILCGLFVLLDPRRVLDVFFGGRAAPVAYEAFTYTEAFREGRGPLLLALLLFNVPLYLTVLVSGRWSPLLRRVETVMSLLTCAVLVWIALDGPVFMTSASDRAMRFAMVLAAAFTLLDLGIRLRRSVRPAPGRRMPA